jgi:hypothetical protein
MRLAACLFGLALLPCSAQKLYVYSPLTRIDPFGKIVKADRGQRPPRHILSPGVPRNAYSSLRVVVELDKPGSFHLDIGQNPDNAVGATLYKEVFAQTPDGWVPERLVKVLIPYAGTIADFHLPAAVPGQTTSSGTTVPQVQPVAKVVTFWLDMWVDAKAAVDRVKVEPQLWAASIDDWVVYPMEVRIQVPVVTRVTLSKTSSRGVQRPGAADTAVWGVLLNALCGKTEQPPASSGVVTPESLLRRNALQHLALVRDKARLGELFTKASEIPAAQWCAAPSTPAVGPEWYLRFRDLIYRDAGAHD